MRTVIAVALFLGLGGAKPASKDGGVPHDMATAPPTHMTRGLSDAWNLNALRKNVLEAKRDQILAELARLKTEEQDLAARLKTEYQVDPAVDNWDERTLEIHRRTP